VVPAEGVRLARKVCLGSSAGGRLQDHREGRRWDRDRASLVRPGADRRPGTALLLGRGVARRTTSEALFLRVLRRRVTTTAGRGALPLLLQEVTPADPLWDTHSIHSSRASVPGEEALLRRGGRSTREVRRRATRTTRALRHRTSRVPHLVPTEALPAVTAHPRGIPRAPRRDTRRTPRPSRATRRGSRGKIRGGGVDSSSRDTPRPSSSTLTLSSTPSTRPVSKLLRRRKHNKRRGG